MVRELLLWCGMQRRLFIQQPSLWRFLLVLARVLLGQRPHQGLLHLLRLHLPRTWGVHVRQLHDYLLVGTGIERPGLLRVTVVAATLVSFALVCGVITAHSP
jgi:hypothetical protein